MREYDDYERFVEEAERSRSCWLAKQAADALSEAVDMAAFERVLEEFELEPLDHLYSILGFYIEDRTRRQNGALDLSDNPF